MAKYNFPNIQKLGAEALSLLIASTVWGATLLKSFLNPVIQFILEKVVQYLANKGLIILNIGAFYINGEIDQTKLDKAIDDGLKRVQLGNLTPQEIEEIDNEVISAANNALPYSNELSDVRNSGHRSDGDSPG